MDDEDPLGSLADDLVLFPFPDFTAVLEPTNLQKGQGVKPEGQPTQGVLQGVNTKRTDSPWLTHATLHIQTWQILSH